MIDNSKKTLGEHLRKLREDYEKNRTLFAKKINEIPQYIYDYEVGRKSPSIEILIQLYKVLNKSFEELLKPLMNLSETKIEVTNLIRRLNNVCLNERNIDKLDGFLTSLEQDIEEEEKRG